MNLRNNYIKKIDNYIKNLDKPNTKLINIKFGKC